MLWNSPGHGGESALLSRDGPTRAARLHLIAPARHFQGCSGLSSPGTIARYRAARALTGIEKEDGTVTLQAPFASPSFTVHIAAQGDAKPTLTTGDKPQTLREVARSLDLKPGAWTRDKQCVIVCFDLPKGRSFLCP